MKKLNKELLELNIENAALLDINENNVFGSSYMVCQEGEVVYKKHFGFNEVECKTPVDDKTIFRLASMTKPVTAFAILILIDRGLLSLNDEVKKFFPEFGEIKVVSQDGKISEIQKDITILHLLTHTSGLGCLRTPDMTAEDKLSVKTMMDYFLGFGLDFEPFSRELYSGVAAFDVLVAIIEKITQTDYNMFLKKEIFDILGMVDTTFIPSDEQWKRVIQMHNKVDRCNVVGKTFENCVFEDFPATHKLGGAGLISTINDYSKFAEMLLKKGKYGEKQLISVETFNLMSTPHVPKEIMNWVERWGLGVRVITEEEYKVLPVGTFGWSGAYGTHFWVDPINKITAVFMKNSHFDGGSANKSAVRFEEAVNNSLKG